MNLLDLWAWVARGMQLWLARPDHSLKSRQGTDHSKPRGLRWMLATQGHVFCDDRGRWAKSRNVCLAVCSFLESWFYERFWGSIFSKGFVQSKMFQMCSFLNKSTVDRKRCRLIENHTFFIEELNYLYCNPECTGKVQALRQGFMLLPVGTILVFLVVSLSFLRV